MWSYLWLHQQILLTDLQCCGWTSPVKLHILSWFVQQMQETVHYLVLTDALVADQQEMLTEDEIFQHGRHNVQMLRIKYATCRSIMELEGPTQQVLVMRDLTFPHYDCHYIHHFTLQATIYFKGQTNGPLSEKCYPTRFSLFMCTPQENYLYYGPIEQQWQSPHKLKSWKFVWKRWLWFRK